MRKHNEGYTLPLVMVVLLVLSLVAVTIMTDAMRNLKTQERLIQQMQDQYAAQGEIEKIIAQLENGQEVEVVLEEPTLIATGGSPHTLDGILVAQSGSVAIRCGIKISADKITGADNKYSLENLVSISYTSYEITTNGGAVG